HRLVAADVYGALHARVDDEGGAGGAGHVLDEGRQLDVLHPHRRRLAGRGGREGGNDEDGQGRGGQQHQAGPAPVRVSGTHGGVPLPRVMLWSRPSRRKSSFARGLRWSSAATSAKGPGASGWPLARGSTSPGRRPAWRSRLPSACGITV